MAKFKTRARALDLLGRQQIAGIPTALNELIKNAHDAYANNFDINYLRKQGVLVLRDDGMGMTREEFETRWLTIGTESKLLKNKAAMPVVDKEQPLRPIMGEKGIGRLAIASIGSQVLVLTKARGRKRQYSIVASLVFWRLFELPGLNLEDIVIPVKEFDHIPNDRDVLNLKSEVVSSIQSLHMQGQIDENDFNFLMSEIDAFKVNPIDLNKNLPGEFHMDDVHGGTYFYISQLNDTLNSDLIKENGISKIEKLLLGFHNTMTPNHAAKTVDVVFRDFPSDDYRNTGNLLDDKEFFAKEDFQHSDHHIEGVFDEFGQFKGRIRVYDRVYENHIINWNGNNFKETSCGKFKIDFAYLQGKAEESNAPSTEFGQIQEKLKRIGGLYIYKDNIRILPYGTVENDFLKLELRRNKRMGDFFFSFRRMFGVVAISSEQNSSLVEKAGREGFIENKAFRQLVEILQNFLGQLNIDFFNKGKNTQGSSYFQERQLEIQKHHTAITRKQKLAASKKKAFESRLAQFFLELNNNEFEEEKQKIALQIKDAFDRILSFKDLNLASQMIIDTEMEFRKVIREYHNRIYLKPPVGFQLSKIKLQDYDTYVEKFNDINNSLIPELYTILDKGVDFCTKQLNLKIDNRERLINAVEEITSEVTSATKKKRSQTNQIVKSISEKTSTLVSELAKELNEEIRQIRLEYKELDTQNSDNFDLGAKRKELGDRIELTYNRNANIMDTIIRQLQEVRIDRNENGELITDSDMADALNEELEELKQRLQSDTELAQLGLTIGIINHEFNGAVRTFKMGLKDLKAYADIEDKLSNTYKNLKLSFDHLNNYIALFTPLNRRLYRKEEDIKLTEIRNFLFDLFENRLERHEIRLIMTKGFTKRSLHGFRSTFYPVFVNLVDNAIYWLKLVNSPREIRLHATDDAIYVSNNGISIPIEDENRIFEMGFSRKDSGRGMGLAISREVLQAVNYEIKVDEPRKYSTVTFKICKKNDE